MFTPKGERDRESELEREKEREGEGGRVFLCNSTLQSFTRFLILTRNTGRNYTDIIPGNSCTSLVSLKLSALTGQTRLYSTITYIFELINFFFFNF